MDIMVITSDIKKLNSLNQDIKKIGSKYYVFDNNLILIEEEQGKVNKGEHFCVLKKDKTFEFLNNDSIKLFFSDPIFKTIQKKKKDVEKLILKDNIFYLMDKKNTPSMVGKVYDMNDLNYYIKYLYPKVVSLLESEHNRYPLSEENKEVIKDCGLVTFNINEYKIRICKELIPNFKIEQNINIFFNKVTNEKKVFQTIIEVDRGSYISYHIYHCINF